MFGESYKDYLDDQDDAAMWDREEYLEVLGVERQDDWDDGGGSADDERLAWAALYDDDTLPEEDEGDEREDREPQADGYTPAVPVTPEIPMPCDFLDEDEIPF